MAALVQKSVSSKMKQARVRNTAPIGIYEKALKANLGKMDTSFLQLTDDDDFVCRYEEFLADLLKRTKRPSKDMLVKALNNVFKEAKQSFC